MNEQEAKTYIHDGEIITGLRAEIDRLTAVVKKANYQAERFEREWYLRGDEIERLTRELGETNEALAACQSQAAGEIRHLRTMLKTVGDDYPGSSLQEWIYEILGLPSPSATLLEKFRQETSNGTSR